MHLSLEKRTALVCGGSSGLGFGVALAGYVTGALIPVDGGLLKS
ncbi:hypothetical protein [Pseudomonas sp. 2FG]|nr:hypothetical protein [Pseudomonas sp. 2FG]